MLIDYEGFDNWTSSTDLSSTIFGAKWSGIYNGNMQAGTLGGFRIRLGNADNIAYSLVRTVGAITSGQLIVGFRLFLNAITTTQMFLRFLDSAGAVQCGMSINAAGHIIFWRGTESTILGTGTATLLQGNEYFVSCKLGFSNSADVEVRVNAVSDISLSSVDTTNTANQNCGSVGFVVPSGAFSNDYDDFYIMDDTGSAPYNDFLAEPIRVETLLTAANDSVSWAPLSGTNESNVDDTAVDSDSTYNSTSSPGDIDTFTHAVLSNTPDTIYACKVDVWARKEDVSNKTLRSKLISGGTTQDGTTSALQMRYTVAYNNADILLQDPDTSADWDEAGVNATKIGYELVT